ncbi:MAG: hypothetical protein ACOY4T_11245 [Pseudomonadota bacterium]|jgi:hypothetical protein
MPKYVFAYHGGSKPATPEEGAKAMAAWTSWFNGLGKAVLDGGNPCGPSQTVSKSGVAAGGGANPISGYSLIDAPSMAAATRIAQGCPILANGGTIEVAEAMPM